jgi:hypothetical protein
MGVVLGDIGSAIAVGFVAAGVLLGLVGIGLDIAERLERRREPDTFTASSDPLEALWRLPYNEEAQRRGERPGRDHSR